MAIFKNIIPIAIYEGVYYRSSKYSLTPLIIGATATSIVAFIKNRMMVRSVNRATSSRSFIAIGSDILVCTMLVLLYHLASLQNMSLSIFLAIDIGIYFGFEVLK